MNIQQIYISEKNKIVLKNIDNNFEKPYSMEYLQLNNDGFIDGFINALLIKQRIINLKSNLYYCINHNYIREWIILCEYKYRLEKLFYEYSFNYLNYFNYNSMIESISVMLNDNKIKMLYKNIHFEEINELIKSSNQLIDYFMMNFYENNELFYCIMKYKHEQFKYSKLKEELMANVWHPRNFNKFKYLDPETFDFEEE